MSTFESGLNPAMLKETSTVVVSALLETTGQVRFGDGTEINVTVTEKDIVPVSDCHGDDREAAVEKVVFAGTKRRGVDRRAAHELRNRYLQGVECYIPHLCGCCPICLLYGFTGTTREKGDDTTHKILKQVNCKSRLLYATSYSVEPTEIAVSKHSRNQVNELTQTTAGSAGIHAEELIVAGVHFPVYTALCQVLPWEVGVLAHAFLEDLTLGRYTAASRAQGGMRVCDTAAGPALIVDESTDGMFPLGTPKVASAVTDVGQVLAAFSKHADGTELVQRASRLGLKAEKAAGDQIYTVTTGSGALCVRRVGDAAMRYLRERQLDFRAFLERTDPAAFSAAVVAYFRPFVRESEADESQSEESD